MPKQQQHLFKKHEIFLARDIDGNMWYKTKEIARTCDYVASTTVIRRTVAPSDRCFWTELSKKVPYADVSRTFPRSAGFMNIVGLTVFLTTQRKQQVRGQRLLAWLSGDDPRFPKCGYTRVIEFADDHFRESLSHSRASSRNNCIACYDCVDQHGRRLIRIAQTQIRLAESRDRAIERYRSGKPANDSDEIWCYGATRFFYHETNDPAALWKKVRDMFPGAMYATHSRGTTNASVYILTESELREKQREARKHITFIASEDEIVRRYLWSPVEVRKRFVDMLALAIQAMNDGSSK